MIFCSREVLLEECERYRHQIEVLQEELSHVNRAVDDALELLDHISESGLLAWVYYITLRDLIVKIKA